MPRQSITFPSPSRLDTAFEALNARGFASLGRVFSDDTCKTLVNAFGASTPYRSTIDMKRYNFGRGRYKYFAYPLPPIIAQLRKAIYAALAPLANQWNEHLGRRAAYPETHEEFLEVCRNAGQTRPTPLILSYAVGDYNCLHRDLYGDISFPLQLVILLSNPETDFEGGEFVLTEQRPRMQSRAHVARLKMGEALVFAVNERPVLGTRGYYQVAMRHGVSEVRSGNRFALGVIFHDAA